MKWYHIKEEGWVDSPALLVYPKRIKYNIEKTISHIGDASRLRPHVKTHKTSEIILMQKHFKIEKFKCATIVEAEMLAKSSVKDILLAFPVVGPKIKKFLSLIKKYENTQFSSLVDSIELAKQLGEEAKKKQVIITIFMDINLGMNRTGVNPDDSAVKLFNYCNQHKNLNLCGLHAYDGNIFGLSYADRKIACKKNYAIITCLRTLLEKSSDIKLKIVIGGSPGYFQYATYDDVECSPGTFIFWDYGYFIHLKELAYQFAAVLMCRVISKPKKNLICIDLGYKSIAAENNLGKRFHFLNKKGLKPLFQSEEHLVLQTKEDSEFEIGEVLYIVPYHICPTIALYGESLVIEDNEIVSRWKIKVR